MKYITEGQSILFIKRRLFEELIYWTKDLQDYKIHVVAIGKKKKSGTFYCIPGKAIKGWSQKTLQEKKVNKTPVYSKPW